MSGGVDSAVALLAAGERAVGVTLRLWIDPNAAASERVCCSPAAVIAARETCHRLGIPHVTLDLREQFRTAVVEPFARDYAAGKTPNPCVRCNGSFRFDELLAFTDRIGAGAARDRPLRAYRRARTARRRSREPPIRRRIRATCSRRSTRRSSGGSGSRSASRRRTRRALRPCGRACSRGARREPGGVLPRRRRLPDVPLPPRARSRPPGRSSTRPASASGHTTGTGATRRGSGAGSAIAAAEPLYALANRRGDEHRRRRAACLARAPARCGARPARQRNASGWRRSSATAPRPSRRPSRESPDGFELLLDEPFYGVAPGQTAVLYEDGAIVGAGVIVSASAE